jgi:hypothetical protein
MRCRRATLRSQGRSGRKGGPDSAWTDGDRNENCFPIDDIPPDDLPVRDISEDSEEQHPGHTAAITAADLADRDLAGPVQAPSADTPEPGSILSGLNPSILNAALHPEPAAETSSPDPRLKSEAQEPQDQYLLPGLGPADTVEPDLGLRGKQAMRAYRPRSSPTNNALKAAQIELWPDV